MKLGIEEKEKRKEERKKKKWNETHSILEGIDCKLCNKCNEYFPANSEYFYANIKNSIDGLYPYCINCCIKKTEEWNVKNNDRVVQIKHDWHIKHKEKVNIKCKNWSKNNREQRNKTVKEFYLRNPDKAAEYQDKRKPKNHKISPKEWESCKAFFNNSCAYCELPQDQHFKRWKGGLKLTDLHKEHYDDEGSNKLDNCIPSCHNCNSQKWIFSYQEWYNEENPKFTEERHKRILDWIMVDHKQFSNSQ